MKKISPTKFISCSDDLIVISKYNECENKLYKIKKINNGNTILDVNYFLNNILCIYYENNEIQLFDESYSFDKIYVIKKEELKISMLEYFDNDIFISYFKNDLSFWVLFNFDELNKKKIKYIYFNDNII